MLITYLLFTFCVQLFQDLPSPSASYHSTDTEDSVFSAQDSLPSSPTMATTPGPATTPRQQKGSRSTAAIENRATVETPLDFSFLNITDLAGV